MSDTYPDGTVVYVRAVISNPAPGDHPTTPGDITVKVRSGEFGTYRCEVHPEDVSVREVPTNEIYCLKDSDGLWWTSPDPDDGLDLGYDHVRNRWPAFISTRWEVAEDD